MDRPGGKQIADDLLSLVNVMNNGKEIDAFVDTILNSHRTLQQSTAGVLLKLFNGWATMHDNEQHDARNVATTALGKKITDATEDYYIPYV